MEENHGVRKEVYLSYAVRIGTQSLSAVSGPPLVERSGGTGLTGRFGYSDSKEAASSGAAAYGSWMEFSWSDPLLGSVFRVCRRLWKQSGLGAMRTDVWLGESGGAAAEGGSGLWHRLGGHAVAWLGLEAGVSGSCGAPGLLRWGAR